MVQRAPEDITAWRPTLYAHLQSLNPYKRKSNRPWATIASTEPIIYIDSD